MRTALNDDRRERSPDGDAGGPLRTGSRFRNPPLPDRSGRKRDGDAQPPPTGRPDGVTLVVSTAVEDASAIADEPGSLSAPAFCAPTEQAGCARFPS
jgi:hypothetical protein